MQNYLKSFIGLFAILLVLVFNLTYASRGYGLNQVFADEEETETETLPNDTYECDTQDERPVYCQAREKTGTRAILCPYYIVTFCLKCTLSSGGEHSIILEDGPYESFSDLVFFRTPSFEIPFGYEPVQEWADRQTDYRLVREALIECEYVAEPDSRCSPLHKCCSDFVSDDGSGVYENG